MGHRRVPGAHAHELTFLKHENHQRKFDHQFQKSTEKIDEVSTYASCKRSARVGKVFFL